jgi:hypothetical protein
MGTPNVTEVVEFAVHWRAANGIAPTHRVADAMLVKFALDLQRRVAEFAVRPSGPVDATRPDGAQWAADAVPILYSGPLGAMPAWKIAAAIENGAGGRVFFGPHAPQSRLLASPLLRSAVAGALGGADPLYGGLLCEQLYGGPVAADGTRSPFVTAKVLALYDFAARNIIAQAAAGDMRTLTVDVQPDSIFVQTELSALLAHHAVTAINGVQKTVYQAMLNKTGSLAETAKAVAAGSYALSKKVKIGSM